MASIRILRPYLTGSVTAKYLTSLASASRGRLTVARPCWILTSFLRAVTHVGNTCADLRVNLDARIPRSEISAHHATAVAVASKVVLAVTARLSRIARPMSAVSGARPLPISGRCSVRPA